METETSLPFVSIENPLFDNPPDESPVVEPKKRGRKKADSGTTPKASTSRKKNPDVNVGVALQQVSAMLAGMLAVEELAISELEANLMGDAINRVASYYELPDMGVVGAWINLGIVSGMVLFPRIKVLKDKSIKKKESDNDIVS